MTGSTPIGDKAGWLDGLLAAAIMHCGDLSEFQADFVSTFVDRFDRYGERTLVSEKQMTVLRAIEKRLEES